MHIWIQGLEICIDSAVRILPALVQAVISIGFLIFDSYGTSYLPYQHGKEDSKQCLSGIV